MIEQWRRLLYPVKSILLTAQKAHVMKLLNFVRFFWVRVTVKDSYYAALQLHDNTDNYNVTYSSHLESVLVSFHCESVLLQAEFRVLALDIQPLS